MKLQKVLGATSEIWQVFVQDSSSTIGAGLAGLAFNTSSLTAYYHRDTDTTATAITLATMTVGTFTSSGFKEIDATNMPGWYQFCPPNAALAAGAKSCGFHLKGATNMAPLPIEVQLVAVNPDDAVRLGLTALPNAAAEASGGLYTRGSGAGQLSQSANGEMGIATLAKTVTTYTGNTVQTGDSYARIGAPTGASIAVDIQEIEDFIDSEIAEILAAVDTEVAAIKTQTDKLTFTVANQLDSNMQYINDTPVIGDGAGTPWNHA